LSIAIMAVLVACFAATTLDTATRLQRYVLQELAATTHVQPLTNMYLATGAAIGVSLAIALLAGEQPGTGGMLLWPLFGATNQLLAGLAFMVVTFYLWRRQKPIWIVAFPMVMMLLMPAWALSLQLFGPEGWLVSKSWVLFGFGIVTLALQIWMVAEGLMIWPKARGMLEEALPPLTQCDV
ncbi:MAG: carbon starvation protein A, partial [Planctomycetales bacterium]|nr:carbon starvation protein A [Planctomycetales bacterium]